MRSGVIIIVFSLALMLASCSIETIDYTTSDFTPNTGKGPNAKPLEQPEEDASALRILQATSMDGINWQRVNEEFIDRAGAIDVITNNEGHIFLYYVSGHEGLENVWVAAVSTDQGKTWAHKHIIVEGVPEGGRIVDTSTILLEDGRFRSYFQSHFPQDPHTVIRSATSVDGLHWVLDEGVRIQNLNNGNLAVAPNVIEIDGTLHLYALYASGGQGKQNMHFTSEDGLTFTEHEAIDLNLIFANSEVINNQIITYSFHVPNKNPAFQSALYYTTTTDGFSFTEAQLMLEVDGAASNNLEYFMLKEPDVIQLEDGSYLMFYLTGFSE